MSSYNLSPKTDKKETHSWRSLLSLQKFLTGEKTRLIVAGVAILVNSGSTIVTPYLISIAIDSYISKGNLSELPRIIWLLVGIYLVTVVAGYLQANIMGRLSLRTLYRLREVLFSKIQFLPVAFFNQNKIGDLISRLNNDTDKLNQFLSESVIRFVSIFFTLIGVGVFVFFLNFKMALVTISVSLILVAVTALLSPWVEKINKKSLQSTGNLSAEVQESLTNFKVIVAFNRQEYFREKFQEVNSENFKRAYLTELASGLFNPIYNFAGNIAQILVLFFGFYLISKGELSIGLLIGFITYTQKFYEPLRILGSIWGSLQSALAAWWRIQEIMSLENNLKVNLDTLESRNGSQPQT